MQGEGTSAGMEEKERATRLRLISCRVSINENRLAARFLQ